MNLLFVCACKKKAGCVNEKHQTENDFLEQIVFFCNAHIAQAHSCKLHIGSKAFTPLLNMLVIVNTTDSRRLPKLITWH